VVSPREIISEFGADTARLFILFAAPAEKDMDWSDEQVQGQHRFLGRVWRLVHSSLQKIASARAGGGDGAPDDLRRRTHKTILKVTQQLERLQFNTAISSLMELSNAAADWTGDAASLRECLEVLVQLLAPFAPHFASELWRELGRTEELAVLHWPEAEPALVVDDAYQIAVQVNGKLRGEVQVAASANEGDIRETAARDPKISGWLQGKTIKKVVVIPKRLVNFVVA
jgi:leucyl-tRNA synthetase